jgi:hypothetical protein
MDSDLRRGSLGSLDEMAIYFDRLDETVTLDQFSYS